MNLRRLRISCCPARSSSAVLNVNSVGGQLCFPCQRAPVNVLWRFASSTTPAEKREKCWNCGAHVGSETLFCSSPQCGVVQVLKTEDANLFDTFGLPTTYNLDESKLDIAYKNLQKKLHPDKFVLRSIDEKSRSTQSSSTINHCYEVIFALPNFTLLLTLFSLTCPCPIVCLS